MLISTVFFFSLAIAVIFRSINKANDEYIRIFHKCHAQAINLWFRLTMLGLNRITNENAFTHVSRGRKKKKRKLLFCVRKSIVRSVSGNGPEFVARLSRPVETIRSHRSMYVSVCNEPHKKPPTFSMFIVRSLSRAGNIFVRFNATTHAHTQTQTHNRERKPSSTYVNVAVSIVHLNYWFGELLKLLLKF